MTPPTFTHPDPDDPPVWYIDKYDDPLLDPEDGEPETLFVSVVDYLGLWDDPEDLTEDL